MCWWMFFVIAAVGCHGYHVEVPDGYAVLQGDLRFAVSSQHPENVTVELVKGTQVIAQQRVEIANDTLNATVTFACGTVTHAGSYALRIASDLLKPVWQNVSFDVRWPLLITQVETQVLTYRSELLVRLRWIDLKCSGSSNATLKLYLVFCGLHNSSCDSYSDSQIHATARILDIWNQTEFSVKFECDSVSRQGFYRVFTFVNDVTLVSASDLIHAKLGDDFQVQVRPKYVFPCGREVHVTYTNPPCVGPRDRIRLYGRRYANISAAIATPFSVAYITEKYLIPIRKILAFPCQIFQRNPYDAYCFRYVNFATNNAVTDMAETCIPATNISLVSGEPRWAAWSEWSSCIGSCLQGVRYRYRYCSAVQSIPGLYCKGDPIESDPCALAPCTTTVSPLEVAALSRGANQSIVTCSRGCQIYLNEAHVTLIASDADCSTNRTIKWRIRAAVSYAIKINFRYVRIDCQPQNVLRIRNGISDSAELLAELKSTTSNVSQFNSTSNLVTLELNSTRSNSSRCVSGFIVLLEAFPVLQSRTSQLLEHRLTLLKNFTSSPTVVLLSALVIVLVGSAVMVVLYSKCGIQLKHIRKQSSETKLSDGGSDYDTFSETSFISLPDEAVPSPRYQTLRGRGAYHQISLPNSPCLRKKPVATSRQRQALRRSMTSSPQTLRKWVQSSLNIDSQSKERSESAHLLKSYTLGEQTVEMSVLERDQKVLNTAEEVSSTDNDVSTLKTTSNNTISVSDHDLDLEIDYYDFEIHNAGDVPDSFLRSYWIDSPLEGQEFSDFGEERGTPTNALPFADDVV